MSDLVAWQVVSVIGALAGWAFVAGYAWLPKHQRKPADQRPRRWWRRTDAFRRWWRSGMGINLMGTSISLALIFTAFALDSIVGPYPRSMWMALGIGVAVFMIHRTALLFDDRRKG